MEPGNNVVLPGAVLPRPARRTALEATRRRWDILSAQMRSGHEPCFQTERRHACDEAQCPWRSECLSMRAQWLR